MSKFWFAAAAAALFLTACATEREAPRDAETGVQTVDLREAGSTIVDVTNGGSDVEVIRPNGQIVPLVDWLGDLRRHNVNVNVNAVLGDPTGAIMFESDPERLLRPGEAEQMAAGASGVQNDTCPEYCYHCPEEGAYVCATMCSF